jgi:hypothetical protein
MMLARGLQHGRHTKPWATARGDRNGSRLHPERRPRGEQNPNAKLTEAGVRELRELRRRGWTIAEIAAHFGVYKGTISYVLNGQTWRHVV